MSISTIKTKSGPKIEIATQNIVIDGKKAGTVSFVPAARCVPVTAYSERSRRTLAFTKIAAATGWVRAEWHRIDPNPFEKFALRSKK